MKYRVTINMNSIVSGELYSTSTKHFSTKKEANIFMQPLLNNEDTGIHVELSEVDDADAKNSIVYYDGK